jgi:GT2 family glycosyltransferase
LTADISVAISTVGDSAELGRCLESVLHADRLPSQAVVVDQQANDETRERLEEISASAASDVEFVYVRDSAIGLSHSRNAGIARVTTSGVAFTDDDCVPSPAWIAAVERAFAAGADAVTGPMLPLGAAHPGTFPVASRASTVSCEYHGRLSAPWDVGTGGNLAVKREWLSRVRGYDPRLGAGSAGRAGEDVDLIHRLLRSGARIRYEPDAVVYHARQSADRRRSTRVAYGWGIGAACGIWWRSRDREAAFILVRWLRLRGTLLLRAAARARWRSVFEELLVLGGTARGLLYGVRAGTRQLGRQ